MTKLSPIIKIETIALLREPISVFFIFVLPLALTVIFGSVFGEEMMDPEKQILGIDTIFPVNLVFIAANIGLMGIPICISEIREKATLKRYFTYPIKYINYFFSLLFTYFIVNVISSILVFLTCFLFFNASFYMDLVDGLAFLVVWLFSVYIFYGIGYIMVLYFKSSRSTNIASTAFFMVMIFGSGVAIPLDSLPDSIRFIANLTPMAHSINLLGDIWISDKAYQLNWASTFYLLIAAVIVTIVISKYRIRWEA